jgi:cell wall-associated NlpC family hydrolase
MRRALLLSLLVLVACSSVNKNTRVAIGDSAIKNLASYAHSLEGSPYRYGGSSPETGFDCSGFVDHVFYHAVGIRLPRSSYEMSRIGQRVSVDNLRVGDLVFFDTLRHKYSHVGIYLGEERFIHAPSNGGRVRTESMRDPYWKRRYNGARRITLRG